MSSVSVLTLPKCLNIAYRQTKDKGGFGDFSVLKSPYGPSKAQISCSSGELWGSEWIMPHFCASLGWYRPGQQDRGLQRLLVVLYHSAMGAGYLPLLKYCVLFPTKCSLSSSSLRLRGEESGSETPSQKRVAEAVQCAVGGLSNA